MISRNWVGSALVLAAATVLGAAHTLRAKASPTAAASFPVPALRTGAPPRFATSSASLGPEAERLGVRRQLYESVDALVQAGEFQRARQLLDRDAEIYGAEVAPEWRDLGRSYRLIADCLEHPSAPLRKQAMSFALASHAASLASRVLAACATTGTKPHRRDQDERSPSL